jgi:pilus assembly protein Flp/PilA
MRALFAKLISDKAGVTAIEYGLIAALIVIGDLVTINSVGLALNLSRTFSTIATKL